MYCTFSFNHISVGSLERVYFRALKAADFFSHFLLFWLPHNLIHQSLEDGASYCYCAYVLRISGYSVFLRNLIPLIQQYFRAAYDYVEKVDLSKGCQNPKRKIFTHFSEIIELKFGKKLPYVLCILTLF